MGNCSDLILTERFHLCYTDFCNLKKTVNFELLRLKQ